MTIDLKKVIENSKTLVVLANQKRALKEEYDTALIFYINGGSFKITKELISFLVSFKSLSQSNEIVLLDQSDTPVRIEDLSIFLESIVDRYISASNNYFSEYQKLKNSKTVESILDL